MTFQKKKYINVSIEIENLPNKSSTKIFWNYAY